MTLQSVDAGTPDGLATSPPVSRRGRGPWATAALKLAQDRAAVVALAVLALIVIACALAPVYASAVSGTDPFASNISGTITLDGQEVQVMQPETEGLALGTTPIGPTGTRQYFLGADSQGRDVMARLFYGGRASLLIAAGALTLTLILASIIGIAAGFFGGIVDAVLSRLLDVLWAFPVYLLAISLSVVTVGHDLHIGPVTIGSGSLVLPIVIIGLVYTPYVARPVRGQVLQLRRADFVLAAEGLGVPRHRILVVDILPNVSTTLIVFAPLMMALDMITESALSFLSIGVQPPNASWGTIIEDGQNLLYSRPWVAIAPGVAIALTVVALNVFGDGLRDALDPRAKLRVKG